MDKSPTKRPSPPLVTLRAEPGQPAPQSRGGTQVFEVRDSWAPGLGEKMARATTGKYDKPSE